MTKETMYVYLGTNGTICSPIHLEDVYYIRKMRLWADEGIALTKDGINLHYRIIVPENEVNEWYEISKPL